MERTPDIVKGTLDLLVLKALSWGPAHGYTVAKWVESATADALALGEGTLYPALYRLEERGWVTASWGMSENKRSAKFYALTKKGRVCSMICSPSPKGKEKKWMMLMQAIQ